MKTRDGENGSEMEKFTQYWGEKRKKKEKAGEGRRERETKKKLERFKV